MNKKTQKLYDDVVKTVDDEAMKMSREAYIELCDELSSHFQTAADACREDQKREDREAERGDER